MHQGYPYLGNAVPNSKMAFDLHVLKAMGCNFLRTTHITMDPVVLEMADRLGFWSGRKFRSPGSATAGWATLVYDESARHQMREMIRRDRNHPSIILWSTMNEAAGGESRKRLPATLKLCRELHEIAQAGGPHALHRHRRDGGRVLRHHRCQRAQRLLPRRQPVRARRRARPASSASTPKRACLISEYGAPNVERGAFGHGPHGHRGIRRPGSRAQHARVRTPAVDRGGNHLERLRLFPRQLRTKGVTDEARYPKDAYYYYQSQWSAGTDAAHSVRSAHWNFAPEGGDRRTRPAYDVAVDSNCDRSSCS